MIHAFLPVKWVTLEEAHKMFPGTAALKPLYVRYFVGDIAWYVCRDDDMQCHKITGPWDTEQLAVLSLDVQQKAEQP